MKPDGSQQVKITPANTTRHVSPVWSPNGDFIYFGIGENNNINIYRMKPDGTEVVQITFTSSGENVPTAVSPDGTRVAFNRLGEVYVMNNDGSDWFNLTQNPANDGAASWEQ